MAVGWMAVAMGVGVEVGPGIGAGGGAPLELVVARGPERAPGDEARRGP